MTEQTFDFRIIFVKLAELEEQSPQEMAEISLADIKEFDEIRVLREIVLEVQSKPQVYFATT